MILAIAGKELRRLFASPLAWVVLAFLQLILAWIFLRSLQTFLDLQAQLATMPTAPGLTEIIIAPTFGTATVVLLMVVPLLSMRLISEERRNQTLPFLMSAPVSISQIVLGKFAGLLAFLCIAVMLLLLMALSLYLGGKIDIGLLAGNVLGLLLLCGCFAAVGLYFSSLTAQPLIAGIGTFAVLLGLWLINISTDDPESPLHLLSLIKHYDGFSRGVVTLQDGVYYVVLIALFLLLSIRRLDGDRLRT